MRREVTLLILLFLVTIGLARTGGPDPGGYSWIDSKEALGPRFNWIDIRTTGTDLGWTSRNHVITIDLGDTFRYYDVDYTEITICSNGWVALGRWSTTTSFCSGFPSTADPDGALGLLWTYLDPLYFPTDGGVFYEKKGEKFIISFEKIQECCTPSLPKQTFQVILNLKRSEIIYQYLDVEHFSSRSARIGFENGNGTIGLNIGNWGTTGGFLEDSLAIRIRNVPVITPPYSSSFEGFKLFSVPSESTSGWEWGFAGSGSPGRPAHSGARVWGTRLDFAYANDTDWVLISPNICLDYVNSPFLDFWQNYIMQLAHDCGIVEISDDQGFTWVKIEPEDEYPTTMVSGPISGQRAFSGNSIFWIKASFDLKPYVGEEVIIRFRFLSDDDGVMDWGWYIDDFGVYEAYGHLEGTVDLMFFIPDDNALVEIVDLGRSVLTDSSGYFRFDSVLIGEHYIRISKNNFVPNDSIPFGLIRFETESLHINLAPELYFEDFETDNGHYISNPLGGWRWGMPDVHLDPNYAYSDTMCWGTDLSGNYANNCNWKLSFKMSLSGTRWPLLSFYHWYKFKGEWLDQYLDGGNIKVSVDSGVTWQIVYPFNGYDGLIASSNPYLGGQQGFGGEDNGNFWHQDKVPLYHFAGNELIIIQFEIGSDDRGSSRGWYIDDVRLSEDSTTIMQTPNQRPSEFYINISPNPFNRACEITFTTFEVNAVLNIYDISGRIVDNLGKFEHKGLHKVSWKPKGIPSGVYLVQIKEALNSYSKTVLYIK